MDAAYFVGKKEILTWINDLLSLNIARIEDTASGAVAAQVSTNHMYICKEKGVVIK
jgi:RP/EB family microtubule-associated protein